MAEFDQDDIRRPGIARDPGVRADFTPTLLTPVADPISKAMLGFGADMEKASKSYSDAGRALFGAANGQQQFAAQMSEIGSTFRRLSEEKQVDEDSLYRNEINLELSQRALTIEQEELKSPNINKPDFPKHLDRRLVDMHKEVEDGFSTSGRYLPSDRAKRLVQDDLNKLRLSIGSRAVTNAFAEREAVFIQSSDKMTEAIARQAATLSDPAPAFIELRKQADQLRSRLPASQAEKIIQNNEQAVLQTWGAARLQAGDKVSVRRVINSMHGESGPAANNDDRVVFSEAQKAGEDPLYLIATGQIESGRVATKPSPGEGKTASGYFQIIDQTWMSLGNTGSAKDAPIEQQAAAAAKLSRQQADSFELVANRAPTYAEKYTMHFLGQPVGLAVATANPDERIEAVLARTQRPDQAKAVLDSNPFLKGMTAGQVLEFSNRKISGAMKHIQDNGVVTTRAEGVPTATIGTISLLSRALHQQDEKDSNAAASLAVTKTTELIDRSKTDGAIVPDIYIESLPVSEEAKRQLKARNAPIVEERYRQDRFEAQAAARQEFFVDPSDKATKARADAWHGKQGGDMNVQTGEPNLTNNDAFVKKFGLLPSTTAERLKMSVLSQNPLVVEAGMKEIVRYAGENPTVLMGAGVGGELKEARDFAIAERVGAGTSDKDIARKWIESKKPGYFTPADKVKNDPQMKSDMDKVISSSSIATAFQGGIPNLKDIPLVGGIFREAKPEYATTEIGQAFVGHAQKIFAELRSQTPASVSDSVVAEKTFLKMRDIGVGVTKVGGKPTMTMYAADQHPQIANKSDDYWAFPKEKLIEQYVTKKLESQTIDGVKIEPGKFHLVPEIGVATANAWRSGGRGDASAGRTDGLDDTDQPFLAGRYRTPYKIMTFNKDGLAVFSQPGKGVVIDYSELLEMNRQEFVKKQSDPGYVPKWAEQEPDGFSVPPGDVQRMGRGDPTAAQLTYPDATGLVEKGNINLNNRPRISNGGKVATIKSASFEFDGVEVLLPTISDDGKLMSDEEAVAQYRHTNRHLGKFKTSEDATRYGKMLSEDQGRRYK